MTIDWDLQEAVWDEFETLEGADRVPVGQNEVEAELVENFHGRVEARKFTFESDEPATMAGGENRGPRPLEYFLAGFALCQQVIYAKNALATGIEIESLSLEANGEVDPRGVLGIGDAPPGFVDDEITYTTRIESPATRDEVAQLVELAERHCPAHASLRTPTSFDRQILCNGERLSI
ncbi:OsmC-related (seleno)protein [Natrarchaeobius sp. A-rgal3]|uniref:OsmC-related (seleno)protein n=1 Tax=Natrarchaeobius versutus TaxID=1679078 RepID=UPI00350EB693